MAKLKTIIFIPLMIAVITALAACNQEVAKPEVIKIVYSEKFLGIAQMTPEDWVTDLINTGEENYVDVYVNEDGASVTLEITDEQKNYWVTSREEILDDLATEFSNLGSGYKIEYNDDYSHIDLYYNLELDAYDAIYYVMYTETFCINQQLFKGIGHDEWVVSFNIYNSDTGKLVTSGDSNTGLSYTEADWEASM